MRLLHVSDWHLGTTLGRMSRAPDLEDVLEEIVGIARDADPHLIVHTGDLFNQARPAVEELHRATEVLEELAAFAPVVVIAGNHDSPALFSLFNELLHLGRDGIDTPAVRFVPRAKPPNAGGILTFPGENDEEIRLAPLPFVHPNALADVFDIPPERWTANYVDQVQLVEEALGHGLRHRYDTERHILLFAAHLHVGGAKWSQSERPLHVSETYATKADHIPDVSYAAFGHIHKPQDVPGLIKGRYCGSPIQIDFGEEAEEKSVVLVEARPGQSADVEVIPLHSGRSLKRIDGTLDEIAEHAAGVGRSIVLVTVDTDEPTPDLARRIADLLPEATLLDVQERCRATHVDVVTGTSTGGDQISVGDLFREYVSGRKLPGQESQILAAVDTLLEAARASAEPAFSQVALFDDIPDVTHLRGLETATLSAQDVPPR